MSKIDKSKNRQKAIVEPVKPFRVYFRVYCADCKETVTEYRKPRQVMDDLIFGYLAGASEPVCSLCGSKRIMVNIDTPGKCVDLTFTDLVESVSGPGATTQS
jgi:hypothetical protein